MPSIMTLENDAQLQALQDFASSENKVLVENLEQILNDVAKTGQYIFPWHYMKPLYAHKLEKVTTEFLTTNPPLNTDGTQNSNEIQKLNTFRDELLDTFDRFTCAPFTLQRVTELLTNPKKYYKTTPKFFRGLEKNIMVVSTIEMVSPEQRTSLKRQFEDLKSQNGSPGDHPSLVKRFATNEGDICSRYFETESMYPDKNEEIDILSTGVTGDIMDERDSIEARYTVQDELLSHATNGNTNEDHNEAFEEESLQSTEGMD